MVLFYISNAIKGILTSRPYRIVFIFVWILLFLAMFYLPIISVPGNDTAFQAKLFSAQDYVTLIIFSAISAMAITMQIKIFSLTRKAHIGHTALGAASGFIATLFATSTCTLCLGAVLSLFGAGAIVTLVEHRVLLVIGSLLLLFFSLYLPAKHIAEGCSSCKVSMVPN